VHAGLVAEQEQAIIEAGAEIIWVLEQDRMFQPGTAESCRALLDQADSVLGWCVGDSQTEPEQGIFDTSPFAEGRGYDFIVDRRTMEIVWTTTHGTTSGNENLSGEEVLAAVQAAAEAL
jgi:hypothetical protein